MSDVNAGSGHSDPADQSQSEELPRHYETEEVIARKTTEAVAKETAAAEGKRALIGLIIGGVVAVLGVLLIILQVSGAVDLDLKVGSLSANVTTSVVGIIVILFGVVIIRSTRAKITIEDTTA